MDIFQKDNILHKVLRFSLLVALIISFYIFVNTLVFNENKHKKIYSTWQFPMILAIYIDTIYYYY